MQSFMDSSPKQLTELVQTNLLGTMLCTPAWLCATWISLMGWVQPQNRLSCLCRASWRPAPNS